MDFEEICRNIRSIKIQGASNVARAAVKALRIYAVNSRAKTKIKFMKDVAKAKNKLLSLRPTEPAMHNMLRKFMFEIENSESENVKDLKKSAVKIADGVIQQADIDKVKAVEIGAARLPERGVVMTHCHSSTVTAVIKSAKKSGKKIKVLCTETRPLMQGRITARELAESGIKVTMAVDSNMMHLVKKADIVLLGSDAIFSEGRCVNKIGSSMLAFLANELNTPLFICSTAWKFAPGTLKKKMVIENRSPDEVWKRGRPDKLEIINPAFDIVENNLIRGIITEFGVLSPDSVYPLLMERRPWMFNDSSWWK